MSWIAHQSRCNTTTGACCLPGVYCRREVWSVKMPDSVLAIQSTDDHTVFAALADGFVAVLQVRKSACSEMKLGITVSCSVAQNVTFEAPDSEPLLVRIGSSPVLCMVMGSIQQLWCGCGNAITILSSQSVLLYLCYSIHCMETTICTTSCRNFEPIHSIAMEEAPGKVYKMVTSEQGVWVSFRS